jgi:RNA polymerase sigma-70 factor (ECF subfamily)
VRVIRPRATSSVVPLRPEAEVSDGDLVERARQGDRFALDALVRRHLPAVAGTVARLLGDPTEAEDVVQDTMAAAVAELAALREPQAFRAWLLRMAVNKVHRRFRRRKWLRFLGLGAEPEGGLADLAAVEASQEQQAELVLLDRVLATLAVNDRVAWSLRCVEGLQLDEVAAACDCSLATAKRRILAADRVIRAHVAIERPMGAKR